MAAVPFYTGRQGCLRQAKRQTILIAGNSVGVTGKHRLTQVSQPGIQVLNRNPIRLRHRFKPKPETWYLLSSGMYSLLSGLGVLSIILVLRGV